jgi:hypothetical protein
LLFGAVMKRTALVLTLIFALLFFVAGETLFVRLASAEPTTLWSRDYPSLIGEGKAVVQTTDGGYAVAAAGANPKKCMLLKVNADGDVQWSKTYGYTVPIALVQTSDGGYALAGFNNYGLANFIKTDAEGNMQWNKTYQSPNGANYFVNSLIQTSDGEYVLVGCTYNWNTDWVVKTDESGNIQWNRTYGMRYGFSLVDAGDGGYAILVGGDIATQSSETFLLKIDSSGNVQWNTSSIVADSLIKAEDGAYVLAGSGMVEKRGSQGNKQWSVSLGESSIGAVAQANDSGYVVVGSTYEDPFSFWNGRTARVTKVSASGVVAWASDYPADAAPTWATSIVATDYGYVFTGVKGYSGTYGDGAIWLVKISEEPTPTPTPSPTSSPTPSPSASPPSPSPSPFSSPSTEPSNKRQEPFPTTLVAVSVAASVAVGTGMLIYFKKRKH